MLFFVLLLRFPFYSSLDDSQCVIWTCTVIVEYAVNVLISLILLFNLRCELAI